MAPQATLKPPPGQVKAQPPRAPWRAAIAVQSEAPLL
jgi:hypothetical protein